MEYYNERNGLISDSLCLDLKQLKSYFLQVYTYFENREYFEYARKGVWKYPDHHAPYMIEPPTFKPSVEVYFANKLQSTEVWPIHEYIDKYDEVTLFTIIEILYDHVAVYDYQRESVQKDYPRREFEEQMNNLLKAYKDGYYLEPASGYIMSMPNKALQEQLRSNTDDIPYDVMDKLSSASKMYYRFDSGLEEKRKAINILADILEKVRDEVKSVFDQDHIKKCPHDKMIFDIVNNFHIRHNKNNQKTEYSEKIWFDWMMQYYTSVIIAYYKIQKDREYGIPVADDIFGEADPDRTV